MAQNMASATGLRVSWALPHHPVLTISLSNGGLGDFPNADVETTFLKGRGHFPMRFPSDSCTVHMIMIRKSALASVLPWVGVTFQDGDAWPGS